MLIDLTIREIDAIREALEARAKALCHARDVGTLTEQEFVPIHRKAWDTYCSVSDKFDKAERETTTVDDFDLG